MTGPPNDDELAPFAHDGEYFHVEPAARPVPREDETKRERAWREWLAGRPEQVRLVAEHFPPWGDYYIKSTGQTCSVYSFGEREDGSVTLTVLVRAEDNPERLTSLLFPEGHRVFGLSPDDVAPLPAGA